MLLQTIDGLNKIPLAVDGMEADHQELSEASPVLVTRGKMSSSDDPDTISDESGYSEESNATLSSAGGVSSKVSSSKNSSGSPEAAAKMSPPPVKVSASPVIVSAAPVILSSEDPTSKSDSNGCYAPGGVPVMENGVDLSVKGVLISDFSSSEQLKFLERRRSRSVSPFSTGQIQPDFCINI